MNRDRTVQLTALVVMVLALALSVVMNARVAASAGRNLLVYTERVEDALTPEETLGIAAGAFRGMFVNWLWMRAQDLKQEGKYFEAVDLAKTITRLQPKFPRVWVFHAWNLAYNISVATQTPSERWQWVNAGIRLLRDEGIQKNPNDLLLHKELAWILLHKVQGVMDDANQYYKKQFAQEWTIAMGMPPTRTKDLQPTAKYQEALVKWLRLMAEAPRTLDELVAREEELARREDPKIEFAPRVRELVDRIRVEAGLDLTQMDDILKYRKTFEIMRSLSLREFARQELLGERAGGESSDAARALRGEYLAQSIPMDARNDSLIAILREGKYSMAITLLNRHLRHRILVERYHMEPDRMIRYTQKYGPLDWRLPHAHGVYWSARGVEEALDKRTEYTVDSMDFLNTDRLTLQGAQECFRAGTLLYDIATPDMYLTMPSADFIDTYGNMLTELMERERQQFLAQRGADTAERVWTMYRGGYENFLDDAISFLYRRGDKEGAKKYQLLLATWPGRVENDILAQQRRELPLDEFVVKNIEDRITSPNVAVAEITGSLQGAFISLLNGDDDAFRAQMDYARKFHLAYMKEQYRKTAASGEGAGRMEVISADFREAASVVFAQVLVTTPPQDASIMYLRAPADLQVSTYAVLDEFLGARDEKGNRVENPTLTAFFPKPDGVDEYIRARNAARGKDVVKGAVEQR